MGAPYIPFAPGRLLNSFKGLRWRDYIQMGLRCHSSGTAILMLNMGGPRTTGEVHDFLKRLFSDRDIIRLPLQSKLGPYIAQRRTSAIEKKYEEIGGGSPIGKWTDLQGSLLCKALDEKHPLTAPHKHFATFRYAHPLTEDVLKDVENSGFKRAIAFSQYPQYSCSTAGSSFNAIYKYYKSSGNSAMEWSVIDRWHSHPLLAKVFAKNIMKELVKFPKEVQKDVVLLFSAHSLPLERVDSGDPYPAEVATTVHAVMKELGWSHGYRLVWQSKVGPKRWLAPSTDDAIKEYVKKGKKHLMLVPIAFVNEHIETLHELDIEYADELGKEVGAIIKRVPTPNDDPMFIDCISDVVIQHMASQKNISAQFMLQCPKCINPTCKEMRKWFSQYS